MGRAMFHFARKGFQLFDGGTSRSRWATNQHEQGGRICRTTVVLLKHAMLMIPKVDCYLEQPYPPVS